MKAAGTKRDWRTPISAEDLASDSTMVGQASLLANTTLQRDDTDAVGTILSETTPLVSGTSLIDSLKVEKLIRLKPKEVLAARIETTDIVETPVEKRPPETSPIERDRSVASPLETTSLVLGRSPVIRIARLVQDGHTSGEQRVYDALWKTARPIDEHRRRITIGLGKLSQLANLGESNVKPAVLGLIDKLALELVPDQSPYLLNGRTYQVLSWAAVLKRRKDVGYTHVIKTRGVIFVDPTTGARLTAPKTKSKMTGIETTPLVSSRLAELDEQILSLQRFVEEFPNHMQHDQDMMRLEELKQRREEELRGQ